MNMKTTNQLINDAETYVNKAIGLIERVESLKETPRSHISSLIENKCDSVVRNLEKVQEQMYDLNELSENEVA